jgi:hypothetical protein
MPNDYKIYQITIKYTKWPQNIANGRKIHRPHGYKTYQHLPLQEPPKFTQIGIFGFQKINHLATLLQRPDYFRDRSDSGAKSLESTTTSSNPPAPPAASYRDPFPPLAYPSTTIHPFPPGAADLEKEVLKAAEYSEVTPSADKEPSSEEPDIKNGFFSNAQVQGPIYKTPFRPKTFRINF